MLNRLHTQRFFATTLLLSSLAALSIGQANAADGSERLQTRPAAEVGKATQRVVEGGSERSGLYWQQRQSLAEGGSDRLRAANRV